MPARGPSRPLPSFGRFLGRTPSIGFPFKYLSFSVGLPATTLSTRPHSTFREEVEIVLVGLKGPSSSIPSMNADIGDATPLEGDVKLPNMMGLQ